MTCPTSSDPTAVVYFMDVRSGGQKLVIVVLWSEQVQLTPMTISLDVPKTQYRTAPVKEVYKPYGGVKSAKAA